MSDTCYPLGLGIQLVGLLTISEQKIDLFFNCLRLPLDLFLFCLSLYISHYFSFFVLTLPVRLVYIDVIVLIL